MQRKPLNFKDIISKLLYENVRINTTKKSEYTYFQNRCIALNKKKIFAETWLKKTAILIKQMLNRGLFPNASIFAEIMKGLCQHGYYQIFDQLLDVAIKKNVEPAFLCHTALAGLTQSSINAIQEAALILKKAEMNGLATAETYKAAIDVVTRQRCPKVLHAVCFLEQAKKAGMANRDIYLSTLDAIAKSATPDTDLAQQLLKEFNIALPELTSDMKLDLSGLSFGIAYFCLKSKFTELLAIGDSDSITIYYGGADKELAEENYSKAALNKILGEIKSYSFPLRMVEENPGELSLTFLPSKLTHSPRLFQPTNSLLGKLIARSPQDPARSRSFN